MMTAHAVGDDEQAKLDITEERVFIDASYATWVSGAGSDYHGEELSERLTRID